MQICFCKSLDKSFIFFLFSFNSERAANTGATGDRLKEGAAINQSLSCLGNCIHALAERAMGKNTRGILNIEKKNKKHVCCYIFKTSFLHKFVQGSPESDSCILYVNKGCAGQQH